MAGGRPTATFGLEVTSMRAKDIMTRPAITVTPDRPIKVAASLLIEHAISALPVVDEQGELIGIVSEGDLVPLETRPDPRRHLLPTPQRQAHVPLIVQEVMTRDVVALPEDADVAEVARLMLDRHVKRIPIVRDRHVVGIVSRRDLLKVLARDDGDIRHELDALLSDEILSLGRFTADVRGGVAVLVGPGDRASRRLAELLARSVPGVLAVEFADEAVAG
jgi:CBS domain-containing protein